MKFSAGNIATLVLHYVSLLLIVVNIIITLMSWSYWGLLIAIAMLLISITNVIFFAVNGHKVYNLNIIFWALNFVLYIGVCGEFYSIIEMIANTITLSVLFITLILGIIYRESKEPETTVFAENENSSLQERLEKVKKMYDDNIISKEEYEKIKASLIQKYIN